MVSLSQKYFFKKLYKSITVHFSEDFLWKYLIILCLLESEFYKISPGGLTSASSWYLSSWPTPEIAAIKFPLFLNAMRLWWIPFNIGNEFLDIIKYLIFSKILDAQCICLHSFSFRHRAQLSRKTIITHLWLIEITWRKRHLRKPVI